MKQIIKQSRDQQSIVSRKFLLQLYEAWRDVIGNFPANIQYLAYLVFGQDGTVLNVSVSLNVHNECDYGTVHIAKKFSPITGLFGYTVIINWEEFGHYLNISSEKDIIIEYIDNNNTIVFNFSTGKVFTQRVNNDKICSFYFNENGQAIGWRYDFTHNQYNERSPSLLCILPTIDNGLLKIAGAFAEKHPVPFVTDAYLRCRGFCLDIRDNKAYLISTSGMTVIGIITMPILSNILNEPYQIIMPPCILETLQTLNNDIINEQILVCSMENRIYLCSKSWMCSFIPMQVFFPTLSFPMIEYFFDFLYEKDEVEKYSCFVNVNNLTREINKFKPLKKRLLMINFQENTMVLTQLDEKNPTFRQISSLSLENHTQNMVTVVNPFFFTLLTKTLEKATKLYSTNKITILYRDSFSMIKFIISDNCKFVFMPLNCMGFKIAIDLQKKLDF